MATAMLLPVALLWILVPNGQVNFDALKFRSGVYNLTRAADVPAAKATGVSLVLARHAGASGALTQALTSNGMKYIDTSLQSLLYRAYCPRGLGSCKALTYTAKTKLISDVKSHVKAVRNTGTVAAYYILDDYYSDMGPGLDAVYKAIRSLDAATPTMCAFYQDLAYKDRAGNLIVPKKQFPRALRNYSSSWCNAVGIYAYAPSFSSASAPPRPTVEWDMHSVLPWAVNTLKSKGFDPTKQMLVGMPGAFGYEPRLAKPGGANFALPQWRYAPSTTQLAAQITAYCAAGAWAILPYVWDDLSPGTPRQLHNSSALRAGLSQGVSTCKQRYWR